jgi:hypothetical protein
VGRVPEENCGYLVSEVSPTAPSPTTDDPVLRHVSAMSVRGQVELQSLGNGVTDSAAFDDSTGLMLGVATAGNLAQNFVRHPESTRFANWRDYNLSAVRVTR